MPNYFYTDANGQKQGPISGTTIREFAKTGQITPTTTIESEDGKTFPASKVKGLEFFVTAQPTLETTNEVYGTAPPPPPSPIAAPTPFVSVPRPIPVSNTGKNKSLPKPALIVGIAVATVLLLLVVGGIEWSLMSGKSTSVEPQVKFTAAERAEVDKFVKEYGRGAVVHYLSMAGDRGDDEKLILKCLKYFVSKGADVNAKDGGDCSLDLAALYDMAGVAEFLVSKGADVNTKSTGITSPGCTPLHWASGNEVAEFLVSKGADVNAKADGGATPLHMAENVKVARFLVSKGADINIKDGFGRTPLDRKREWLDHDHTYTQKQKQDEAEIVEYLSSLQ